LSDPVRQTDPADRVWSSSCCGAAGEPQIYLTKIHAIKRMFEWFRVPAIRHHSGLVIMCLTAESKIPGFCHYGHYDVQP